MGMELMHQIGDGDTRSAGDESMTSKAVMAAECLDCYAYGRHHLVLSTIYAYYVLANLYILYSSASASHPHATITQQPTSCGPMEHRLRQRRVRPICPFAPLAAHPLSSHLKAFAQALSYNDVQPLDGDSSPLSPRPLSLPPESPRLSTASLKPPASTWNYGPDDGAQRSGRDTEGRVEKLTATSDFAVSINTIVCNHSADGRSLYTNVCLEDDSALPLKGSRTMSSDGHSSFLSSLSSTSNFLPTSLLAKSSTYSNGWSLGEDIKPS